MYSIRTAPGFLEGSTSYLLLLSVKPHLKTKFKWVCITMCALVMIESVLT